MVLASSTHRAGSIDWQSEREHLPAGPACAADVCAWPENAFTVNRAIQKQSCDVYPTFASDTPCTHTHTRAHLRTHVSTRIHTDTQPRARTHARTHTPMHVYRVRLARLADTPATHQTGPTSDQAVFADVLWTFCVLGTRVYTCLFRCTGDLL